MKKFKYIAMDIKGAEVEDTIPAESQAEAIQKIREKGLFPTRLTEVDESGNPVMAHLPKTIRLKKPDGSLSYPTSKPPKAPSPIRRSKFSRITSADLAGFARKIATMCDAGLPLLRALRIILKQERNGKMANAIFGISEAVEGGSTFSEALGMYPKIFGTVFVNMAKAGEAGGVLEVTMNRLADYLEKENEIRSNAITSFLFVTASAFLLTVLLALLGKALTLSPIIVGAIVGIIMLIKNISLYMRITLNRDLASFHRMLGTLLSCGVPILQALNITRDTCRRKDFAKATQLIHDSVKEGDTMSMPMEASGCFPSMAVSMVDVGEETGALPEMLMKIAETHEKAIDFSITRLHLSNSVILSVSILIVAVIALIK